MPVADLAIALLVGLALGTVLGLLGGGGGILAIPAFVHILGMPVDQASTTSLLVVAIGAAAGLVPHAIAGRVAWRIGLLFGAFGILGSVVGARLAIIADDRLQLAGLSALIFLAASGMLRDADDSTVTRMRHRIPADAVAGSADRQVAPDETAPVAAGEADAVGETASGSPGAGGEAAPDPPADAQAVPDAPGTPDAATESPADEEAAPVRLWSARMWISASAVGLVTGFFGVGGGFVAVPALIWGAGLPVRRATATGLVVIVMNSLVALAARGPDYLPWPETGVLGATAIVGAVVGGALSARVPARTLKRTFGGLLIVIGLHEVWQLALLYD